MCLIDAKTNVRAELTRYSIFQKSTSAWTGFEQQSRPAILRSNPSIQIVCPSGIFDSTLGFPGEGPGNDGPGTGGAKYHPPLVRGGSGTLRGADETQARRNVPPLVRKEEVAVVRPKVPPLVPKTGLAAVKFPYYGNWGGPNYGSGEPIDETDAAYRRHDKHYESGNEERGDRELITDLALRGNADPRTAAALLGFGVKHALGIKMDPNRVPVPERPIKGILKNTGRTGGFTGNATHTLNGNMPKTKKSSKKKGSKKRSLSAGRQPRGLVGRRPAPAAMGFRSTTTGPKLGSKRVTISHRELIWEVYGSVAFEVGFSCILNPGNPVTFPWLSSLAAKYDSYRFKYLRFEYQPTCTTVTGSIAGGVDFDCEDKEPQDMKQLMAYEDASNGNSWDKCEFKTKPANLHKIGPTRYISIDGSTVSKTNDAGIFYLATSAQANTAQLGNLYVSYVVDLITPAYDPDEEYTAASRKITGQSGESLTAWMGTDPVVIGGMSVSPNAAGGALVFNEVGQYFIQIIVTGTTPAATKPSWSSTGNVSLGSDGWVAYTAGTVAVAYNYAQVKTLGSTIVVNFTNSMATITSSTTRIMYYSASIASGRAKHNPMPWVAAQTRKSMGITLDDNIKEIDQPNSLTMSAREHFIKDTTDPQLTHAMRLSDVEHTQKTHEVVNGRVRLHMDDDYEDIHHEPPTPPNPTKTIGAPPTLRRGH